MYKVITLYMLYKTNVIENDKGYMIEENRQRGHIGR